MPIDHWMTFGTFASQRYFTYPKSDTYRGVVINANMAAHAPAGLAAFLLERTADATYIIDPLTHAFQHDPPAVLNSAGELKSSIRALAEAYGNPVSHLAGRRPLMPDDLAADGVLQELVRRCLDFQEQQLARAMRDSDVSKYLDLGRDELAPYALIAPYFCMTEADIEDWLPVCVEATRLAVAEGRSGNVFASIVVSQGVTVRDSLVEMIGLAFDSLDVSGFLLWIDDFDEQNSGLEGLQGVLGLARRLRNDGAREVINLHGGYFSVLAAGVLGGSALSGVAHGPEFGETRAVVPVGGGIPIARYYIPQLHARVRYRDALGMLRAKDWLDSAETFHANVCNCRACSETIAGNPENFVLFGAGNPKEVRRGRGLVRIEYPSSDTKARCLRHYLQRKAIEYQFSETASSGQILDNLRLGAESMAEVAGLGAVAHLRLWAEAFEPGAK